MMMDSMNMSRFSSARLRPAAAHGRHWDSESFDSGKSSPNERGISLCGRGLKPGLILKMIPFDHSASALSKSGFHMGRDRAGANGWDAIAGRVLDFSIVLGRGKGKGRLPLIPHPGRNPETERLKSRNGGEGRGAILTALLVDDKRRVVARGFLRPIRRLSSPS
jgi:hypothetical protein